MSPAGFEPTPGTPRQINQRLKPLGQDGFTIICGLVSQDSWIQINKTLYCWCHSDSASVLLYFTFLSHLFPLPCGHGSTVPREGFDSSVIMPFS